LRNGFNEFARAKGLPSMMTGVGSLFQIHFREPPIVKPRDLFAERAGPLRDFQVYLRLNGVFIPWLHLAFISAAHSDPDVEQVLRAHQAAIEASFAANQEA
jgi:glutamate-1-semialdehyde aminotransferase